MTTSRARRPSGPAAALVRRRDLARRWLREEERGVFAFLAGVTLVCAGVVFAYSSVTAAAFMVPLLLTVVMLSPRRIPPFVGLLLVVLAVETFLEFRDDGIPARRWVAIVLVLVMSAIVIVVGWRRARLGVAGLTGDAMLIDLQDRIRRQGDVPPLPPGWHVDVAVRSAGGTSFAGDFMVAHREGSELSLVLVDVSGKGVDAGTRSLLLSGAFGALLAAAPPARFLPSANGFLLRQAWGEGFATAVHLCIDLGTGDYELRSAGHPPAIQFRAGAGTWQIHNDAEDPILGVVPDAEFRPMRGRLGAGDALMLYTDGLVERPRRDIGLGIDRLIGEAERRVRHGFAGSAQGLVDRLGASNDDCALVVLQRD